MGKRFDALVFPRGKHKAFTLSYDDGVVQDRKLVQLFDYYGVKGTFNLNANTFGFKGSKSYKGRNPVDVSKIERSEVKELYKNQEIGGHSLNHPDLAASNSSTAMYEIIEDKKQLEELSGEPLKMFAYPFGTFNDETKQLLKLAGYKGARTTISTHSFKLPDDPFELNPTCHHNDKELLNLVQEFISSDSFRPQLFYVWGHGYEFDDHDNWKVMDELLSTIALYKDRIWFATNGEILTYLEAYERLEYSADGSMIHNPSAIDVEIYTYDNTYEILKAGTTTRLKETGLL